MELVLLQQLDDTLSLLPNRVKVLLLLVNLVQVLLGQLGALAA